MFPRMHIIYSHVSIIRIVKSMYKRSNTWVSWRASCDWVKTPRARYKILRSLINSSVKYRGDTSRDKLARISRQFC